jgi:hypothetical protein
MSLVRFVAADRRPELLEALAERAAGVWEALRAEDQENDGEDQDQVRGLKDCVEQRVVLSVCARAALRYDRM